MNPFAVHLKLIQHCKSTLLQFQKKKKEKKKKTTLPFGKQVLRIFRNLEVCTNMWRFMRFLCSDMDVSRWVR